MGMPEELVSEILSRLPVKSLMRFKSVCKLWYILIKTPNFITNHHKNQKPHLLVHHYIPQIDECHLTIFPDDSLVAHEDLDYIQIPLHYEQQLIGPVNGLFLFYTGCSHRGNRIALWNPATREFRSLPIPLANHPPNLVNQFGFGFDPLTNDYKVVWIRDNKIDEPIITLYTLANDSWRYLDLDMATEGSVVNSIRLIMYCMSPSGVHLNGAYYWLSRPFDRSYSKLVLFDITTHLFREIQGPETSPYFCELVLHNDSIALLGLNEWGVEFLDMWVMKLEGCWTKVFSVGTHLHGWPLGIWKTGEIFIKEDHSSQLILYNTNNHDSKNLGIQGADGLCIWVFSYKESLVSVKGGSKNSDPIANLSDVIQHFFMRCCVCLEEKIYAWCSSFPVLLCVLCEIKYAMM